MNDQDTPVMPEGVKEAFYGYYGLIQKRGIAEVAAAIATRPVISKAELIAIYLLGVTQVGWAEADRAWNEKETLCVHLEGSDQFFEKHPGE
jgi:hypothetical protein